MVKRVLLLIPLLLCPRALARAEDWPQWRGPERTGISKDTGLLPAWPVGGPKLLWIFRDAGVGYSSMAVVGDQLYSMGGKGSKEYVYAIDLNTQKKLWSTAVGPLLVELWGDGPRSTPTVDRNFLYALGSYGDLICVEKATGKKVWSQALQARWGGVANRWGYCESPLVDGDLVLVTPGGKKGAIAAFDKKTGALRWRSATSPDCIYQTAYSSIMVIEVGGIRQYVQMPRGQLSASEVATVFGVRASDGKVLWNFPTQEAIPTSICRNDCVYVTGDRCQLVKLARSKDQFKVEQIYENASLANHHGGVILVGEHVYGHCERGWACQNFKTGKAIWNKNLRLGHGSVACADGHLYCYHEDKGDVLLIKATPAGYQEQGRFRISEETKLERKNGKIWSHPVVANGKLYLRDQDLIFCYDVYKHR